MREIPLTGGKSCLVDDCDYDFLSQWKWQLHPSGYARRTGSKNGVHYTIWLHRLVHNTPDGFETDHINCDKLDNRRSNLRTCTRCENAKNVRRLSGIETGLLGVRYRGGRYIKGLGRFAYEANLLVDKRRIVIGRFLTAQDAHKAYLDAVQIYHGAFGFQSDAA